jgi:DHA1 family bicyclomycin/chloramphenicol resistance-like MFS transporter
MNDALDLSRDRTINAAQTVKPAEPGAGQKYLGSKGFILFLAFLSAFPPLSTDLYLPSLPVMTRYFQVPAYLTNLTLILFFIFFSLATLVWGPLSDKYGRRPVLITGVIGYTLASMLCAVAPNVYQLVLFRVFQALGGGAASAVATAIVKDAYQGKKQESILALVQSMVVLCPAAAPVLGALLLKFVSWRGVFWTQALWGLVVVAGSLAFRETLRVKSSYGLAPTLGRLGAVLKNSRFTILLIIFSAVSIPFMAFISASSYIYQNNFGLSSQVFSYYFAFNAAGLLLGPLLYVRLSRHFRRLAILNACFVVLLTSGILICLLGRLAPWLLALTLLPASIAGSCTRPPSTFLMLAQQENDAGSASSLLGSFASVMGSVGIILASFAGNLILTVGALYILVGLLGGGCWLVAARRLFAETNR